MRVIKICWKIVFVVLVAAQSMPAKAQGIQWQPSLNNAKQVASTSNRLVIVHFWAPWCKPCMQLEREVFSDPQFAQEFQKHFVPVKLNADHFPATARQYGVDSLPTDVIMTSDGKPLAKVNSVLDARRYLDQLISVANANGHPTSHAYAGVGTGQSGHHAAQGTPTLPQQSRPGVVPNIAAPQVASQPTADPGSDPYSKFVQQQDRQPFAAYTAQPGVQQPQRPEVTGDVRPRPQGEDPRNQRSPFTIGPATQDLAQNQGNPQQQRNPQESFAQTNAPGRQQGVASAPAAHPPVGLDGYCSVELADNKRWVKGDPRWGAIHEGHTYLFAGPEQQQKFLTSPQRYGPAFGGNDPVLVCERDQFVAGQREHGVYFRDKIYLFVNKASVSQFMQNPEYYTVEKLQARRANQGNQYR